MFALGLIHGRLASPIVIVTTHAPRSREGTAINQNGTGDLRFNRFEVATTTETTDRTATPPRIIASSPKSGTGQRSELLKAPIVGKTPAMMKITARLFEVGKR
jgi:hypothetical protein